MNISIPYNFNKNSVNTRPPHVKSDDELIRLTCRKEGKTAAEAMAKQEFYRVKDWVVSEKLQGRSGNTSSGKKLCTEPKSPSPPKTYNYSAYNIDKSSPINMRKSRKKSKNIRKTRKTRNL
jgi:hypothetical protein